MNLKLLIISGIYPPDIGGPASYLPQVTNYMTKRGVNTKIFTYGDVDSFNWKEKVVINRNRNKFFREIIAFFVLLYLAKNVDCMFTNGNYFKSFLISIIFNKKNVLKVVGDTAWERAKNWGVINTNIDDFDRNRNLYIKIFKLMRDIPVLYSSHVITPSNYLNHMVKKWTSNKNITTIYNGVNTNNIYINKNNYKNINDIRILIISRLVKWKNIDKIIELALINDNIYLDILGDGPEFKKLFKLINDLKLSNRITLHGHIIEKKTVNEYYRNSFCLILNSDYEGLSHVLLEAMANSCPVICSNILGNKEVIKHEFNGLLFPVNDLELMLSNINKLKNYEFRKMIIINGLITINEKFNIEKNFSELFKLLFNSK